MVKVESIINKLLFKHDKLVIPGLGTLSTKQVSAEIDEDSNSIKPPRKEVLFDQEFDENNELLQAEIQVELELEPNEAYALIEEYVNKLKVVINSGQVHSLVGVGEFSSNEENKIEFNHVEDVNFLEDSFGLPELSYKPILREQKMKQVQSNQQKAIRKAPVRKKTEAVETETEEKKSNKAVFILIPSILLVGILAFFLLHKMGEAEKTPEEVVEQVNKSDDIQVAGTDVPDVAHDNDEDENHESEVVSEAHGQFYIIAGVYSTQQNADVFLGTHPEFHVEHQDEYYRVYVQKYESKEEALENIDSLREQYGESLWILNY